MDRLAILQLDIVQPLANERVSVFDGTALGSMRAPAAMGNAHDAALTRTQHEANPSSFL